MIPTEHQCLLVDSSSHALYIATQPTPACRENEVLIRVHASGINRPDLLQRNGQYHPPPDASPILGLEVAGEVVAIGDHVSDVAIGDSVCALTNGGGYAEYVAVPSGQCLPIPRHFSMIEAAALPECLFTVWHNVFQRGALKAGETLLVHCGTSGIGTFAIQLGRAMGATVLATASCENKIRSCILAGAHHAMNYTEPGLVDNVRLATNGHGVDVILDMLGGEMIASNMAMAANDGRIVSIAFLQGARVECNFAPMLLKRLTLTGSTLRAQPPSRKSAIASELLEHVWPLLNSGSVKPVIDSTYPIGEAEKAHMRLQSRQHTGKIVLTLD